ncbi:hypothetical protein LDENG_00148470 [Lucifuga dentata]|nr:hypothetical protein LDENG_00148470 [Lucifuga dentata]
MRVMGGFTIGSSSRSQIFFIKLRLQLWRRMALTAWTKRSSLSVYAASVIQWMLLSQTPYITLAWVSQKESNPDLSIRHFWKCPLEWIPDEEESERRKRLLRVKPLDSRKPTEDCTHGLKSMCLATGERERERERESSFFRCCLKMSGVLERDHTCQGEHASITFSEIDSTSVVPH